MIVAIDILSNKSSWIKKSNSLASSAKDMLLTICTVNRFKRSIWKKSVQVGLFNWVKISLILGRYYDIFMLFE